MSSSALPTSVLAPDFDAWRARIRAETFGSYHIEMGVAIRREGDPAAALACFERALAELPASGSAHVGLIGALEDMGRADAAEQARQRALAINPHYQREGLLERARVHASQSAAHEDALSLYPRVAAAWPECAEAQVYASYWYELTGQSEPAAAAWRLARQSQEDFNEECRMLAQAYFNLGATRVVSPATETSIPCFERAALLAPERPELLVQLIQGLNSLGRSRQAIALLPAARALFPANALLETAFIASFIIEGDFAGADRGGQHCARIAPDNVSGILSHSLACMAMGDMDRAEALLANPLAAATPRAGTCIGLTLHTRRRLEEAEAAHQRSRQANPQDIFAMVNLALLYEDTGREALAAALHAQAIATAPRMLRALARLRPAWARDRLLQRYDAAGI